MWISVVVSVFIVPANWNILYIYYQHFRGMRMVRLLWLTQINLLLFLIVSIETTNPFQFRRFQIGPCMQAFVLNFTHTLNAPLIHFTYLFIHGNFNFCASYARVFMLKSDNKADAVQHKTHCPCAKCDVYDVHTSPLDFVFGLWFILILNWLS